MRRIAILAAVTLLGAAPAPLFSDAMEQAATWPAEGSDNVTAQARPVAGASGRAVAMSYDFGRVSGYAFIRRKTDFNVPRNYEIRFRMRGQGGRNDFQFKLTDGDNVWWKVWRNHRPSADWQEMVVPAGEIVFAWGPTEDKTLRHVGGLEFVVARNRDGGEGRFEIDDLRIIELPGEPTPAPVADDRTNDALKALAKAAPRGAYPRAFLDQQPYWTLAGSDGGRVTALIDEDAAIEPAKGSYSVAPVVVHSGRQFSWASVRARQGLAGGKLPIPSVLWEAQNFQLVTRLVADHSGRASYGDYALTNRSPRTQSYELRLQVRPWQVNPPAQFLSQKGGASPISSIVAQGDRLIILQPQEDGDPPLARTVIFPGRPTVSTSRQPASAGQDMAQADLSYRMSLRPGETGRVVLVFPHSPSEPPPPFAVAEAETVAHWQQVLGRVRIAVPPAKQAFANTVATAFAHILTSRDGPMLKPGTRSYNRAWIRDGAMMSEGLLRMGRSDVARQFSDWYRTYLFDNGKVPCCVDFRGADPVPENDSHGEYIFMVSQLYRFTGDRAALERDWPAVLRAVRYMDKLRRSERTAANRTPGKRMLYGLMPPSISHEGYSAKAQYSLWDDFWALRGYRDAAEIARVLRKPQAREIAASRDQFAADVHSAILAARDHWKIDFIPGATSLGDFDATSTTIALDPGNEERRLDQKMLLATFERYWTEFRQRAAGQKAWKDYTPYETRTIGTFVRLGWRDRLDELIAFFMNDRRPADWNQWAEVVGRDYREVRFIGDMPHAWVASDFVRGALDMFAWDRREDRSLVLGGGLSASWLGGNGSSIEGLATAYGSLDFAMRGNAQRTYATIGGTARPPGGFVLDWPFAGPPPRATVDGRVVAWQGRTLRIAATGKPIRIEIGQ
jgi:hypothetical protein